MTLPAPELPYFCDAKKLPAPLPTPDEIEGATHDLPCTIEPMYKRIVLDREKFVVKHGISPWVSENEGHALLLLRRYSGIPVPRLYAMYRKDDRIFLIMEFIHGVQLSEVWKTCQRMRNFRKIPSPGTFCSVRGGPLLHRFFLSWKVQTEITGLFKNEEDFHRALALRSQGNWADNGTRRSWTSEFFARNLPTAFTGHPSVFIHTDLQRKNIIVSRGMSESSNGDESCLYVSAIVDWEDAGWYPSYWQYAGMFIDFIWEDDWPEKFEFIVDACPLEAGLLRCLRQDLDY
ncbi:kinase-like domain-containing protein [Phialemonium atrogriseum]|uniref:Kinase-like domain-containing protein n=1 Tax=Phialemonium atrogriseum TaxID=1093897 RepID=A0AAJ0BTT9_9PEZI|nr:kinase-like domain-containing protein [Phialemonium atrogriseum]KAK1762937.1 kinase-like domain-containing protein [Phialemonium atrogriseum]